MLPSKLDFKVTLALILVLNLLVCPVSAKRILFYEIGTGGSYTIETGYTEFASELKKKDHYVASIEKGELTKDKLENYDILVVQDLNKQLTTQEISAIIWFVLQKGRGLFINGGAQGGANQLTIPFGVTVDNGLLIDTSDQIPGSTDRNTFVIQRFFEHPGMGSLRQGVSKIGFYKDSGLVLSGSSKCIATGNFDTYSDTGSFATGSEPCVAAASTFGGGLVMTLSDIELLSNTHLAEYNNKNFGMNIMEWLSMATENISFENSTQSLQLQVKEMRLRNAALDQQVKLLTEEKTQLESKTAQMTTDFLAMQQELTELKEGMVGPLSRGNWALVIFGGCIVIAVILFSQRKQKEVSLKDEDILSELGYELDSGQGEKSKAEGDLGEPK